MIRDPKYLTGNFRNQEIKNLKSLYLDQHLTKEQLSAFGAAVADVAVGVGLAGEMNLLTATSYIVTRRMRSSSYFIKANYYILHRTLIILISDKLSGILNYFYKACYNS